MIVSNRLLGTAGAVVGGLGTHKALLEIFYSPACIRAIERASQFDVSNSCPPGFDNFALVNIIGLGAGLIIVAFFWKDILQEILKKVFSSE
jgi:hypothetical protein